MPQKKKQSEKVDKRYRAKIVIPGVEKPVWLSAKTKKELEALKARTKEEYIYGKRREDIPFVELVREWWTTIKRPSIRTPSTEMGWRYTLNAYVFPYFSEKKLCRAVTRADLQACLDQTKGRAFTYGAIVKSCLKNVCRYAVSEHILRYDPSTLLVAPTPKTKETKRPLFRAEEERILACARLFGGLPEAVVMILYYTGVRAGEAKGLRWEDVLWSKRLIHVQRKVDVMTFPPSISGTKTKAGNRYIPIPPKLYAYLQSVRGLPNQYILGGGNRFVPRERFADALNRVLKVSGCTGITAHYFRHHYITSCVQACIRLEYLTAIVGHASYMTTYDVYTHTQQQMLEDDFKPTLLSSELAEISKVAERLPDTHESSKIF